MMKNMWLDGMMGLVVGDALGVPVQFMSRSQIAGRKRGPVTGMEAGGVFNMPEGTWSDDSSMAFAIMDSIRENGDIVPEDIMNKFVAWLHDGEYTPFGEAFDEGNTCVFAIENYVKNRDWKTCGKTGGHANGNGGLMRNLPACLYYIQRSKNVCTSDDQAIDGIHQVTALTHNHLRAKMASGLHYFMAKHIVNSEGTLKDLLQAGLDEGFRYYGRDLRNLPQKLYFQRIFDMTDFAKTPEDKIKSSGYVIDTIEAAVWCLITTDTYKDCMLKAVNLGKDTDTVAAIAGSLAGLYYGYEAIPKEWVDVIKRKEWIEEMCEVVTGGA